MTDEFTKEMIVAVIEDSELKNYLKRQCKIYLNKNDTSQEEKKKEETIMKLQDQVRLSAFEVTKTHEDLRAIRERYKRARNTIARARKELEAMKRKEDFTDIEKTIKSLLDLGEYNDIN